MRVAWVTPRYGVEVGGGAEEHVRRLAELLRNDLDSTILTTCALDYRTWADHYPAGRSELHGVAVLRFPVRHPRQPAAFDRISEAAFAAPLDAALGEGWMRAQGPDAPGLIEHLAVDGGGYDCVCFAPYLYATTVFGLPLVAERSLLLALAHDEPPLRLAVYDPLFAAARVLVHNTPEEAALCQRRFGADQRRRFVIGLAVDEPPPSDPARFRQRFGVPGPYLLCLGRVEPAKGSDLILARFAELRRHRPQLTLVLAGRVHTRLARQPGVITTGFLDEQAKHDALSGAAVVVIPSPYESLSIAALEAWSHARPTLANAASEALVGQSRRSGGGLWFADAEEFHATMRLLLDNPPLAETLGVQGRRFVRSGGGWPRIREQWLQALTAVASAGRRA